MKKLVLVLVLLVYTMMGRSETIQPKGEFIKPSDKHIQYVGRISFKNPDSPCFTYPGVQINAAFQGTSLKLYCKPMSGYFMAQIDQAEPFKVSFNAPNDSIVTLATALPDGNHTVRLTYIIEGLWLKPEFRGFLLDKHKGLIDPPALPNRKIEFIGNSITCGYGIESISPSDPFMNETENHYYTYAAVTARALNAQELVVARSGIGIYRNYGDKKSGSAHCMPAVYHQTLFNDDTENWDFNRYVPDVVCINLGTNDTSTKPYDTQLLEEAYRKFLKTVRGHYPKAKIVFLSGCLLTGESLRDVKKALDTVVNEARNRNDKEVYRFDFSPATGGLKIGASYHPSLWQHEKMAGELIPYLRELMNWF